MRRGQVEIYGGNDTGPPSATPEQALAAQVLRISDAVNKLVVRVDHLERPERRLLTAAVSTLLLILLVLVYLAWIAHDVAVRLVVR